MVTCLMDLMGTPFRPTEVTSKVRRSPPSGVNGYFSQGEWSDGAAIRLDDDHKLLVKQDNRYLYLAIELLHQKHSGLELFIASPPGESIAFHVSSALGSRTRGPEGWSDFDWRPERWTANVIGTLSEGGKMRVLEPDGFEVQMSRSFLHGNDLFVRIELKRPSVVFPADSLDGEPKGWIHLIL